MPPANLDPLAYDLSMLARGTALAERMLVTWLEHMEVFDKLADFDRLNRCVDSLTRVAAVRKSLIRLAIVVKRYGPVPPAPPTPQSEIRNPQSPSAPSTTPSSISSIGSISSTSVPPAPPTTPQSAIPNPQSEIDYISIPPAEAADELQSFPPIFPESPRVSLGSMMNFMYHMNIPDGGEVFHNSSFGKRYTAMHDRPAVTINHGEPAIYPPDREPNLAETRDVREVAAIPPEKLSATLDRVTADVTTMPGPSTRASYRMAQSREAHQLDPSEQHHTSHNSHPSHPSKNPSSPITARDLAHYATPAEYYAAHPIEPESHPPDAPIPPHRPPPT